MNFTLKENNTKMWGRNRKKKRVQLGREVGEEGGESVKE